MAVLSDKAFLVRGSAPEVEVYNTSTLTKERQLAVNGLITPNDMASKHGAQLSVHRRSDRVFPQSETGRKE